MDPFLFIATTFGIAPESMPGVIAIVMLLCQTLGKAIPDDSTGFLAIVRKTARVIGVYSSNKVSAGVSITDVAKAALTSSKRLDIDDLK